MKAITTIVFLTAVLFVFGFLTTGCGCGDDDDDDSGSGDDDDDDSDDDDDDDDDDTYDYPYNAPVDINGDGQLDILVDVRNTWTAPPTGWIEIYDIETLVAFYTSENYQAASFNSNLNDYDGDGHPEIYLENGAIDPASTVHYRLFDGPDLEEIFTANYSGAAYFGLQTSDFNSDGIVDFPIDYLNTTTDTTRKAVYDVTNGFSTLWDTGELSKIRLELFGVKDNFNFESPADFGTVGEGWVVLETDYSGVNDYFRIYVMDTDGDLVWEDTIGDLGPLGRVNVFVEDFNNDGLDEIAITTSEDLGKAPFTSKLMVLAPPDFSPIYQTGSIADHTYYFVERIDTNLDDVVDLVVLDNDETDNSMTMRTYDGTSGFAPMAAIYFSPDVVNSWLIGRYSAPNRMEPISLTSGDDSQFVLFTTEFGTVYYNWYVYLADADDLSRELIRHYDECVFAPALPGDFDNDGISEILVCPNFLIDDGGGLSHLESYCEILAAPDFDPIYTSETWTNTMINYSVFTDIDRDGVPDPMLTTSSYAEDSKAFLRILDAQNNYAPKLELEWEDGLTVFAEFMHP